MKITSKEQALQIALKTAPELQNKVIYKVTEDNPLNDKNDSENWYIIYSSQDKHCANPSSASKFLALSKETGEIKYKGSI